MIHRVTTSDKVWQRVEQRVAMNDNEWQRMTKSGTMSDNEWQWMTVSGYFGQFSFFFEKRLLTDTQREPFKRWGRLWRGPAALRADLAKQTR